MLTPSHSIEYLIAFLAVIPVLASLYWVYKFKETIEISRASFQDNLAKFDAFAREALSLMKAVNLAEKVNADGISKRQDVAIQQLTDIYNQELQTIKTKKSDPQDMVTTYDGRQIPASKLELISPEDLL